MESVKCADFFTPCPVNYSVAVSDEFYSLTITDTHSGRVLHVEDLKGMCLW